MTETKHKTSSPDAELEITDLAPVRGWGRSRSLHMTTRQRAIGAALTVLLFLLVAGAFLSSSVDVRNVLTRALFSPQSTASPDGLPFYLQGNPDWGHMLVDGRVIAHLPVPVRDQPLVLAVGSHTIIWQVAPFRPRTCHLSVINATTLSGPCLASNEVSAHFVSGIKALVISFFASLNDLPGGERQSLVRQIQQALARYESTEIVRSGERYAVSEQRILATPVLCHAVTPLAICYARAQQPLQAHVHVQMDSSTSPDDPCVLADQCSFSSQDCRALCEDPTVVYGNSPVQGWSVAASVSLAWSYTTLTGLLVARDQPISALRGTQRYQIVSVHITRASQGWRISPFPHTPGSGYGDPLCSQAAQDTGELASMSSGNQDMFVQDVLPAQRAAQGCLVVLVTGPGTVLNPQTPAAAPHTHLVAFCLVRFGVVLAVNQVARQQWPFLPIGDAFEDALAQVALATQTS